MPDNTPLTDPLGNLGVIFIPSWEEKWMTWPDKKRNQHFRETADWSVLSTEQAVSLIQFKPAQDAGWHPFPAVLDEFHAVVRRFGQDVVAGAISSTPTPAELVRWADALGIGLPEAFAEQARLHAAPSLPTLAAALNTVSSTAPPWLSGLLGVTLAKPKSKHRGPQKRPKLDHQEIIDEASRELLVRARRGVMPTLAELEKHLRGKGLAGSLQASTVVARLKGALDMGAARDEVAKFFQSKAIGIAKSS